MTTPKTMTMIELTIALNRMIKENNKLANYKVYISRDSEGNGYSTIDPEHSFHFGEEDKILTIMPFLEGLIDGDIAPIETQRLDNEFDGQVEAMAS